LPLWGGTYPPEFETYAKEFAKKLKEKHPDYFINPTFETT
jgi:hypothetical protein